MILYIGSSADKVYPRLVQVLADSGQPFVVVDEDHPANFNVAFDTSLSNQTYRITGEGCNGQRRVGAIFVRHAVARTLDSSHLRQMGSLQGSLNRVMLGTRCPIINNPANAYSNYSKPYQVGLMAAAGFDVPRTLVTNSSQRAARFYRDCKQKVIFKGVSNVMTFAQRLTEENFSRLDFLPNCPAVFQEFIEGDDYRVHVVGEKAFCTRLRARNEDYRRSALGDNETITAEPAELPKKIIRLCINFTKQLGLVVSGIDFKEGKGGRLVALETNPYPQFTFYEGRSGQKLTEAVVEHLVNHQVRDSNVFA